MAIQKAVDGLLWTNPGSDERGRMRRTNRDTLDRLLEVKGNTLEMQAVKTPKSYVVLAMERRRP